MPYLLFRPTMVRLGTYQAFEIALYHSVLDESEPDNKS